MSQVESQGLRFGKKALLANDDTPALHSSGISPLSSASIHAAVSVCLSLTATTFARRSRFETLVVGSVAARSSSSTSPAISDGRQAEGGEVRRGGGEHRFGGLLKENGTKLLRRGSPFFRLVLRASELHL